MTPALQVRAVCHTMLSSVQNCLACCTVPSLTLCLSVTADQVIQTDQTNILIRALTLKKKKEDTTQAAGSNKGKR